MQAKGVYCTYFLRPTLLLHMLYTEVTFEYKKTENVTRDTIHLEDRFHSFQVSYV